MLALTIPMLFVPVAQAQASPEARLAIALPPGPADVPLGDGHDVPFSVTLTLRGLVCASAAKLVVPLTVKDLPSPLAGVKATPEPAELAFDIPVGSYGTSAYEKTQKATLLIRVAEDVPGEHAHTFEVGATYAGGVPSGCQAAGSMGAADALASHTITTGKGPQGATVPAGGHQMPDGSTMMENEHATTKQTPGAGLGLVLLGLVGVAALRRR